MKFEKNENISASIDALSNFEKDQLLAILFYQSTEQK